MKNWELLNKRKAKDINELVDILGKNRKVDENFFKPKHPREFTLDELKIKKTEIKKAIKRINSAKKNGESVIIYGDYDADGVTATSIIWEALSGMGIDVMPYIPDRFSEGYGINAKSVKKIKIENPNIKLIITVDNGIVANNEIQRINKMGIDVITTDHHMPKIVKKKITYPDAFAVVHTTEICGSAIAWIFARELGFDSGLELAAIGTIADQMPLLGSNRSFVKYGLIELNKTRRFGLLELLRQSRIDLGNIGVYEVNYVIAPRINAMGRLSHAIESLRLLCTRNRKRASDLAQLLSETNITRQKIVEDVVISTKVNVAGFSEKIIFLSDKYHEGVIGLAAGRLVEEFYKPAIVISRGEKISKGSARSIPGFNIIETIAEHGQLLVAFGGHTMAAGFSVETSKINEFKSSLLRSAEKKLTPELFVRKLFVDCQIGFDLINWDFSKKLKEFEPTGSGNPKPTFLTKNVEVVDSRVLGKEKNHLKLKLKEGKKFFDAIGFGLAKDFKIKSHDTIDLVYNVEENEWNGTKSLQLRIRDIRILS